MSSFYLSLSLPLLSIPFCPMQVAFCSQEPFLLHATLRDNILFGEPFDQSRQASGPIARGGMARVRLGV